MRVQDKKSSEASIREAVKSHDDYGDRLIEKWSKKTSVVGKNFQDKAHKSLNKFRNLSIMLENQETYLAKLSETQISSSYLMMPQNVMKVIRLGYGNAVRGEIFSEWAMQTSRDSIWYTKPTYAQTLRDGIADTVTHETPTRRYSSEIEIETVGTSDGSTTNYPGATVKTPVRPYKVFIISDDVILASDDGSGVFEDIVTGTLSTGVASTINYSSGAYDVTFNTVPDSGDIIQIRYLVDTEVAANYDELGPVNLEVVDHQFRPDIHPLEVSWSKKAELMLQTTLDTSIEDSLTQAAAEELKKAADFRALREGYRNAKSNSIITYNADWKSAGADSLYAHAQTVTYAFDKAKNAIYAELQRGGVSSAYGGASVMTYLKLNKNFVEATDQAEIGAYKVGNIGKIGLYQVPSAIVPDDELVTSWINPSNPADSGVSIGVQIPLAQTDRLTFKNTNTEYSLYSFEDIVTLQSKYCRRIKFNNLASALN